MFELHQLSYLGNQPNSWIDARVIRTAPGTCSDCHTRNSRKSIERWVVPDSCWPREHPAVLPVRIRPVCSVVYSRSSPSRCRPPSPLKRRRPCHDRPRVPPCRYPGPVVLPSRSNEDRRKLWAYVRDETATPGQRYLQCGIACGTTLILLASAVCRKAGCTAQRHGIGSVDNGRPPRWPRPRRSTMRDVSHPVS